MTAITSEIVPGAIFGRYRIDQQLGRGGMGVVYAAQQLSDGQVVALKVLSESLRGIAERERFLREGKIAASINHPNAV
jgi:hypothetical protein